MNIGVTFPQNEIGTDPLAIRDYAQAAESLGYSHLIVYDHVLGADPTRRPNWQGYTYKDMFHEPFVLFGYLAALTQLELVTAVLNPLPLRRSIPIWTGGRSDVVLRRTARIANGWFPLGQPSGQMRQAVEQLRRYIEEEGRDPASVGIEATVNARDGSLDKWVRQTEEWRTLGATYASINTMGAGFTSLGEHIEAIRRYKEAIAD